MRLLQEIVATVPTHEGSNLAATLKGVTESLKRRGIVVILSDFLTADYHRELAILSKRHDVIAIRISDPVSEQLPVFPFLSVADPETGETLEIDGASRRYRFEFDQFWRRQRRQWLRECRRLGISAIEISTVDEVAERLIGFFRRRRTR
jgi:uncharacterized protein (DUF58 family)